MPRFDADAFRGALARQYEQVRGALPTDVAARVALALEDACEATGRLRVLDVGVGTGRLALPLAARGHRVVGLDRSSDMLAALATARGELPLALVRADARELPLRDGAFDLALTSGALYLIPEWSAALDEMWRVVMPDGTVVLCDERAAPNDAALAFDRSWLEILARHGITYRWQPAATIADCAAYLSNAGARVRRRSAATWVTREPLAVTLAAYRTRVRPLYADLPDAVFDAVLAEFTAWALSFDPTGEQVIEYAKEIDLYIAPG